MAKEIRLDIAGVSYYGNDDTIISLSTHRRLFDGVPSVGNCVCGELEVTIFPSEAIPRNAEVRPYIREEGAASWKPKGIFFIYNRNTDKETGAISIFCYDAIFRAEQSFTQTGEQGRWPRTDIAVAEEIAARIGTTLSAETRALMVKNYAVQYPGLVLEDGTPQYSVDGALSMREVLGNIGAMYAGNWFINNSGELHLLVLGNIPKETTLLIEENGDYIKLGKDRILLVFGLDEPHMLVTENGSGLVIGGDRLLV